MTLSPQQIRGVTFKQVKRGYEPAGVDAFVAEAADALEAAQNESTAMEARARAAVARLQELARAGDDGTADELASRSSAPQEIHARPDEAETISRTLLLAQRTADTTVADAQAEADRILAAAREEAEAASAEAAEEKARLLAAAKADARKANESERVHAEAEVQALLARRDFLESDVDHLEQHLVAQRERITEAATELTALVQRVPSGLGDMRRPLLSASDEPSAPDEPAGDVVAHVSSDEEETADDEATNSDDTALDDLDGSGGELDEITRIAESVGEGHPLDTTGGEDDRDDRPSRPGDATPSIGGSSLFEQEFGIVNAEESEPR